MAAACAESESMAQTCRFEENSTELSTDLGLLDLFWTLSNYDEESREVAAHQIISCLIKEQNYQKDGVAGPGLNYALKRLVGGLSSTNKATRLGFYLVLVELLRNFPVTPLDDQVLPLIEEHLVASSDKKETSETTIGQSLAYGALIRSDRIYESTAAIQKVTEELLKIFARADYLQELCGTLLLELFSKVNEIRFKKCLFTTLSPLLSTGWDDCTPDIFRITLALSQRFPNTVKDGFLRLHWHHKDLLGAKANENASKILMKTIRTLPRVHPVCKEAILKVFGTPDFVEFWKTFSELALVKSQKENIYLLFEMLKECMNLVTDSSQIRDIFQPAIVRMLMTSLSNKKLSSHAVAVELSKFIVIFAVSAKSSDFQVEVLMSLLNTPGSIMFDQMTGTPVISGILPHLHEDALVQLIALYKNIFLGLNVESKSLSEVDMKTNQIAALQKLSNLLGLNVLKSNVELTTDVLQFLILHSFFDQTSTSSTIPQCTSEPVVVTQDLHDKAKECFFKALSSLTTLPRTQSTDESSFQSPLHQHCHLLNGALSYVQVLIENVSTVSPAVPLDDKTLTTLSSIFESISYLQKRGKRDDELAKSQAFQIMFLHFGLQLLVDSQRTIELIEDLHVCSKKAFEKFTSQRKRTAGASDDPEWMQVVVDVLLSVLSEKSHLLRNVTNMVFPLLVPQMSLTAFRQILDVLNSYVGEEDDDSVLADGNTTAESTGDEVDDSDSSEEDVDDEEEATDSWLDNDDSNQSLRKSVEAALGDAASRSDAEDESDLDDDAMMRIDESLSEAFKAIVKRRPGVSKDEETLIHFHNRCLDLLNTVISRRPSLDFVLESLQPLISAAEMGQSDKAHLPYSQRALASVRSLMNIKKFQSENSSTLIDISETLDLLVSKFKNVLDHRVSQTFSELCTFLVKCAVHLDSLSPSQKKKSTTKSDCVKDGCVQVFVKSLKDFFENRHCAIPIQMFMCLINKYLEVGWTLADDVQKYWLAENAKIFKRSQAVSLLVALTNQTKQVSQIVTGKRWTNFASNCIGNVIQELNKMVASDVKQMYASNLLQLLLNIVTVGKHANLKLPFAKEVKETLVAFCEKEGLSKDVRKPMNKIAALLDFQMQCLKRKAEEPSPNAKKQKLDDEDLNLKKVSNKKNKKSVK